MLSFPAVPQTGIHPSKYCSYLPPPPPSGEGTRHMVPRSRSSLQGSWECLWKHLFQLCQLDRCFLRAWKARECRTRRRRKGSAGRQMLHVIIKQLETIKLCTLYVCAAESASVRPQERWGRKEKKQESRPLFLHLKSVLLPDSLGNAGFNEKIQSGRKLMETQSMLSERGGFPKVSALRCSGR